MRKQGLFALECFGDLAEGGRRLGRLCGAAAGLLILHSGVFARWVGIVALLGALAYFVTFFTLSVGPDKDSVFGYGFFVGFLALAIWAIATSIAQYRGVRPMPASRRRQRPTSMMLILQTPPLENHRP